MNNSTHFPFGKYFLVLEKTKEEDGKKAQYKTLEKENYAEAFSLIKEWLGKNAQKSPLNNCYSMLVEGPEKTFGLFPKEENPENKEDIFFWAWGRYFIIEVVSSLDNVIKKAVCPKFFLVFEEGREPYYFRLQAWNPVLKRDISKSEVQNIKEFEKGLGVLYDSARLESIK